MPPARAKPDPLLSLRVHPSIAAAFLITLTLGTWNVVTTTRENDVSHAAALAELRKDLSRLDAQVEAMRRDLRDLDRGRGGNGGP